GIRDFHLTGVQTCALPIYPEGTENAHLTEEEVHDFTAEALNVVEAIHEYGYCPCGQHLDIAMTLIIDLASKLKDPRARGVRFSRSEERRVGKECRYRVTME